MFHVTSVSPELADRVRSTLVSPQYGHPASRSLAAGLGPCRLCLRTFEIGREDRLLFTYNPFDEGIPAPGPVFVHADGCEPFDGNGFPPGIDGLPLLLEPIGPSGHPIARELPDEGEAAAAIERLLTDETVAMVVVRHAEAGCFIARATRTALS